MSPTLAILIATCLPAGIAAQPKTHPAKGTLANGRVVAQFNSRGLATLTDVATHAKWQLEKDEFAATLAGRSFESASLGTPTRKNEDEQVVFTYDAAPFQLDVVYSLRPTGRFVTKRIVVRKAPPGKFMLNEFSVFDDVVTDPVRDSYVVRREKENLGTKDYGAFLRVEKSRGLLVTGQNPFLVFQRDGSRFSLRYQPAMEWDMAWGPFESDPGLLAPYQLSGRTLPEKMLPEWRMGPEDTTAGMDEAEAAAFTDAVRASLLYKPSNPLNIMVGWCVNDYQIDVATPQGRAEYQRIFDMAATLGAEHVLFAPANSEVSRREESRDDWKWEFTLWLGLGEKIRRNEWDPSTGPIPASVREMLDYARSKKLGVVAYVYPVMAFSQNPEWLTGAHGTRVNLGVHSFQEWLIGALEGFLKHTGISGYAFDHTFLNFEGASFYAQWWGWRRVMEALRRDIPDIVIDGRQAYQNYGPWTWLAGSYPHPTSTDEQPESFVSFPDLKLDRVSADRERYTAYRYRNYEFAPSEIVPGFITHQTGRNDDSGHMPEAQTPVGDMLLPFRQRDWDYLGWRYSLLSSIAIAGWNNVLNMIPARDSEEFKSFSEADRNWFRHWIDSTDVHKDYLRHTRTILGQPAMGKVDGTAAIVDDHGFVFLFNPNGRKLDASFKLDETIGLKRRWRYTVRELYPVEGRQIGKPGAGFWSWGDTVTRPMDGGSALVLAIEAENFRPAAGHDGTLFNSPGTATVEGHVLRLAGVQGEMGSSETLLVSLPAAGRIDAVRIEPAGVELKGSQFRGLKSGLVEIPVTFGGVPFHHYQQIDRYDATFTGGLVNTTFRVPKRVFDQLGARAKAWPLPWTEEDLRSTWLAPHRLLLYVQFAEPDDHWNAALKIDGNVVELTKAYASVRVNRRNFVGFYADVSTLAADVEHRLELELPTGLKPGQFQGVFFENIEPEYTSEIVH
ncbi:MAG TPA: hypothetical protein VKU19_30700 [Bryobacteraceae bacterium]|nr:hypothetical protein [Bryobacteraceae bacterium]